MSPSSWPSTGRLDFVRRFLAHAVECDLCGESFMPKGLAGHRWERHGIRAKPKAGR